MKLHNNADLFQRYVALASQEEQIDEAIIAKDYFVTLALKNIYSINENLIFIGGTSLSKCFGIINRFSEDIDLVATASSRKAKQRETDLVIKKLKGIWEGEVDEQNKSSADFKEMYLHYPTNQDTELDQRVKVELITFMEPFPIIKKAITPIIFKYLEEAEKDEFEMYPINVKTQEPYRTMIEKILLEKELYKEFLLKMVSDESQGKRARDFYDIHKIWQYYKKKMPINEIELKRMIASRLSNRGTRTTINIEELNIYSLCEMFDKRSIGEQLTIIDQRKLSIRDLDIVDIIISLEEIDKYFIDRKL